MFARALRVLVVMIPLAHQVTAQARRGLEVALGVGAYLPTGDLPLGAVPDNCVSDPSTPDGCVSAYERAKQAVAVGGRVTAWLSDRGAVEGSFWYSPSRVTGFYSRPFEQAGNFVAAAMRLVLSLAPHAPAMSALVMGGPAMVHRSRSYDGTTSFGGVLGFALDMHPKRHLGVRAQIEDYLYSTRAPITVFPNTFGPRQMRHDFVLSLSISPFGQRGERR